MPRLQRPHSHKPSSLSPAALRRIALLALLLTFVFGGCGASQKSSEAPSAAYSDRASESASYAPEPAPPAASIAKTESDMEEAPGGDKKKDEEKGGKESVKTWKRSELVPNTTRLMIGDREQIPLRGMQAKITIDGFRARVVLDCHYKNDTDGTYEGTFQLRLPNEATPFFFAFGQNVLMAAAGPAEPPPFFNQNEVLKMGAQPVQLMNDRAPRWTGVKEARMVPNEKAAFAYTETVHRRVDPALMEWSGAGVFSARVFPLMPRKQHRIVIGYDVDLLRAGSEFEYRFDLPDNLPSSVIDLAVAAPQGAGAHTITPALKPISSNGREHYRFEDTKERSIVVRVKSPQGNYLSGSDPKTGTYFAAAVRPEIPAAQAAASSQSAVFMLDTSLSSMPDRFPIWLKMLQTTLEKNRDSIKKFAVLFFNIETSWYQNKFIDNNADEVARLIAHANTLSLEGATDLAQALAEAAKPSWIGQDNTRFDLFLLSDGAPTWGESDLYAISNAIGKGHALFAYQTGLAGTDVGMLNHLARESGGAVFSVVGESEIEKAATAHRSKPWRLVDIKIAGISDVLIAGRPKAIFPGQALLAAGRGTPAAGAEMILMIERDGEKKTVKSSIGKEIASELTPRLYGQIATRQLEDLGDATEGPSKAYAMHFRITGKTCSLLMLESEEDYRRFDIKPEEYAGLIQSRPASAIIDTILSQAASALGDPKVAFMNWLRKMRSAPGVNLALPAPLEQELTSLSTDVFRVAAPRVQPRLREKKDLPPNTIEMLRTHQLDYDVLTEEAQKRIRAGNKDDALRTLSSLVEEQPGDGVLARDVGFSAMEWGMHAQAYHLFRRVAASRPYEPQTYRAMAQSAMAMGNTDLAILYFEVGMNGGWMPRFGEFKQILALDYLRLLRRIHRGELKANLSAYAKNRVDQIASSLRFLGKPDLAIMITWNTDNTDVDLHVLEPTGEECYYSNRETRNGGKITQDVTQGYGPEMYTISGGQKGNYQVRAHYFASDRNRMSARTKVYATIIEGWDTPRERVTEKVVTLELGKQVHEIANVSRSGAQAIAGPDAPHNQIAQ